MEYFSGSRYGFVNESCMVSLRSSIGEISSKISSRPLTSGTSVRPSDFASATRAFHASLPTSQSNDSVCRARRSGTVSVSEILANERREAPRPFLGVVVDALGAAAKGIPPWAREGARFLVVRVECSSFPDACTSHTAVKRGHAGAADHHMRAGGIQERNYLLYVVRRAVSSVILDEGRMLRYKAARGGASRLCRTETGCRCMTFPH